MPSVLHSETVAATLAYQTTFATSIIQFHRKVSGNMKNRTLVRSLIKTLSLAVLLSLSLTGAFAQGMDKRKQTTVQTATVDHSGMKNAVSVRYLNLPWGEATFGYIESGVDPRNSGYYSSRSWPVAHLTLAHAATHDGKKLEPGDYVVFITPKNPSKNSPMTVSIAAFKPAAEGGTFLKAGNVFVETPADAKVISQRPATFAKGAPMIDHLQVALDSKGKDVLLKLHYGDRMLTETLTLN